MEAVTCRLLPYEVADGPTNMAADEVLLRSTPARGPALRFYGWSPATVSLGYFQPAAARRSDPRLAALPWVRRPSGGATLVHHHELTYCLALPPHERHDEWMPRMHGVMARALADLGLAVAPVVGERQVHGDVLCFQQYTPGDLLCRGKKVVGSAQRKYHLALMQHGSVLLAQSEHAPALPGLRELTGVELAPERLTDAVCQTFQRETGWTLEPATWSEADRAAIETLAADKYATAAWNEKR